MYDYKLRVAYPSSYADYVLDLIRIYYVDEYESSRSSNWNLAIFLNHIGANLDSDWSRKAVGAAVSRLFRYPEPTCYVSTVTV